MEFDIPELTEILVRLDRVERKQDALLIHFDNKVYSIHDAAKLIGKSYGTMRKLVLQGKIKVLNESERPWRIAHSEIINYLGFDPDKK